MGPGPMGSDMPGAAMGCGIMVVWAIIAVASLAAMIWAIVDCAKREFRDPNMKIVWIVVIVVLGLLGVIIYSIAGRSGGEIPGRRP